MQDQVNALLSAAFLAAVIGTLILINATLSHGLRWAARMMLGRRRRVSLPDHAATDRRALRRAVAVPQTTQWHAPFAPRRGPSRDRSPNRRNHAH